MWSYSVFSKTALTTNVGQIMDLGCICLWRQRGTHPAWPLVGWHAADQPPLSLLLLSYRDRSTTRLWTVSFLAGNPNISSPPPTRGRILSFWGIHLAFRWDVIFPAWQHVLWTHRVKMPAEISAETKKKERNSAAEIFSVPPATSLPPDARRHETHYLDGIRQHPS